MKIKELLIGLLIIIIPLSFLYICNKRMIKEQCDYNLTCIKNELENNIKNFNKSYETNESFRNKLKKKLIKKKITSEEQEEEEKPQEEEMIEGFFDGIKGWFSGSSPSSTTNPPPMLLPPPANVHQNINESLDSLNKKKTPLVSTKFPPDDNEDIPNLLNTNGIDVSDDNKKKFPLMMDNKMPAGMMDNKMPSQGMDNKNPAGMMDNKIINVDLVKSKNVKDISKNNEDIKLDNDIKLINKVQKKDDDSSLSASNNISNLFGKCQFFNSKCPEGYNSFGNFSIEGVGSNLSLSCGNVRDTKPAKALAQIKNNAIYEIHIIEQGHGYIPNQPPRITIEGGKGNSASAESVVDDNGYLKLIKVVNPGYNYTETPNVVIEAHQNDSNCHFCCKT